MIRTPDARARDTQTKQIQDSITHVEKHFGELCQLFAAYVRKTARLRDKADLLVQEIGLYADTETPNLKNGLRHFADQLAKIQDYRQAQVERLDAKVVEPLKAYGNIVKQKREDLKLTQTARSREAKQMQQLERTRQKNPSDRQIISQAESELQRATMDATRTTRQLEETIDMFERQKIRDIKKILGEFITVEMTFHAKALEVYTTAYQHIQNVDEEGDLEVFRSSLHPPDYQSRLEIVRANSKTSLNHTGTYMSKSGTIHLVNVNSGERRVDQHFLVDPEDPVQARAMSASPSSTFFGMQNSRTPRTQGKGEEDDDEDEDDEEEDDEEDDDGDLEEVTDDEK